MSIVLQGSTSGSITLQEPAVAGSTVLDLPAVSGTILTTTSPKAGNVIQVVSATTDTQVSIGSTTYTDSGLSASITPTSSSSKILVTVNQAVYMTRASSSVLAGVRLLRNSTTILTPGADSTGPLEPYLEVTGSTYVYFSFRHPIVYLDSPATTSSVTYKTQGALRNTANSAQIAFQSAFGTTNSTSTITLMEIAA